MKKLGRPKLPERMTPVLVSVSPRLLELADEFAEEEGFTRPAMLRSLLISGLRARVKASPRPILEKRIANLRRSIFGKKARPDGTA